MQEKLEVLQDAQVCSQLLRSIKNYFSVFASRANMCNSSSNSCSSNECVIAKITSDIVNCPDNKEIWHGNVIHQVYL